MLIASDKTETAANNGESDQELLESKDRAYTINILRERLDTFKQSKGRSSEEFFSEFFAAQSIDEE